jgi:putative transposase
MNYGIKLPKPKKKPGRPRKDDKKILSGIFYILRAGCQWKALPRCYGAPSTVHDRFQDGEKLDYLKKRYQVTGQEGG